MNVETVLIELNKLQTSIRLDEKKGKKTNARKRIYSLIKSFNKFCRIGNRNVTTQFLVDSSRKRAYVEVFNGEGGEKVFTFSFKD